MKRLFTLFIISIILSITFLATPVHSQSALGTVGEALSEVNGMFDTVNGYLDKAANIDQMIMDKISNAVNLADPDAIATFVNTKLKLKGTQNRYARKILEKMGVNGGKFDVKAFIQGKMPPSFKQSIMKALNLDQIQIGGKSLKDYKKLISDTKAKIAIVQDKVKGISDFYEKVLKFSDKFNETINSLGSASPMLLCEKALNIPIIKKIVLFIEKLKKKKIKFKLGFIKVEKTHWWVLKHASEVVGSIVNIVINIYTAGGASALTSTLSAAMDKVVKQFFKKVWARFKRTLKRTVAAKIEGMMGKAFSGDLNIDELSSFKLDKSQLDDLKNNLFDIKSITSNIKFDELLNMKDIFKF